MRKTPLAAVMFSLAALYPIHARAARWVPISLHISGDADTLRLDKASVPDDWAASANFKIAASDIFNAEISLNDCLNRGSGVVRFVQHHDRTLTYIWSWEGALAYDVIGQSLCEYARYQTDKWSVKEAGYQLPPKIGGY